MWKIAVFSGCSRSRDGSGGKVTREKDFLEADGTGQISNRMNKNKSMLGKLVKKKTKTKTQTCRVATMVKIESPRGKENTFHGAAIPVVPRGLIT